MTGQDAILVYLLRFPVCQSSTFMHEIGHALGLTHHLTDKNTIMYYQFAADRASTATSVDISMLDHLYQEETMKKYIFVLVILGMLLTGCGSSTVDSQPPKEEDENWTGIPEDDKIACTSYGAASEYDLYDADAEAATASEYVVYGTVIDVMYSVEEGHIYTTEKLQVKECYKGSLQEGDIILVDSDQGFVAIAEYLDSFSDPMIRLFHESYIDPEALADKDNMYIEQLVEKRVHSEIGMNIFYCLVKSGIYEKTGGYSSTNAFFTRMIETQDGNFLSEGTMSTVSAETGISAPQISAQKVKETGKEFDVASWGQTKEEVLAEWNIQE